MICASMHWGVAKSGGCFLLDLGFEVFSVCSIGCSIRILNCQNPPLECKRMVCIMCNVKGCM